MEVALGLSFDRPEHSAQIDDIVERCSSRLPPTFETVPTVIQSLNRCSAILIWYSSFQSRRTFTETPEAGFAYTGYVTADLSPEVLLAKIGNFQGCPGFLESPGGIASFFYLDRKRDRLTAWASRPMVIGLYYARFRGTSVVGTRPRIVAAAIDNPRWNASYLTASLAAGYPLGRDTPFSNVEALESGEAAVLKNGELSISGYVQPSVSYSQEDPFEGELLRATSAIARLGENEFRLSGGKDSRLVAAAAAKLGLKLTTITRGNERWAEVRIARMVAETLGHSNCNEIVPPPEDIADSMRDATIGRDGVLYPEMLIVLNDVGHYPTTTRSITVGQSHLQRGGWARKLEIPSPRLLVLRNVVSQFVRSEVNDAQRPHIDRWFTRRPPSALERLRLRLSSRAIPRKWRRLDYLFWAHEFFRVSKYLQSLRLFYEPYATCVFPLLDERFVRVCSTLDPRERTMELAVFRATTNFAPGLANIPLYDDRYRFEKGAISEEYPDGYEARCPTMFAGRQQKATPYYLSTTAERVIKETLLSSRTWREARPLITGETIRAIENLGLNERHWVPPSEVVRKKFSKFVWLLYSHEIASNIEW